MIVRRTNFDDVLARLSALSTLSLDTETTGLGVWRGDKLFSLIVGAPDRSYYFNFQEYPDLQEDWILPRIYLSRLKPLFNDESKTWFIHNAKFDLAALYSDGLELLGSIHCTEALGRIERNDRFSYRLDALAKSIGEAKLDTVKEHIKKHKLYRVELDLDGNEVKQPLFSQVPFSIITKYGEQDAAVGYKLGIHQVEAIKDAQMRCAPTQRGPWNILENERRLTKTCFRMEAIGIRIDRAFSMRALTFERKRMREASSEFFRLTGLPFIDSAKTLAPAFDRAGERYPLTDKGNPSFKAEVLEGYTSPIAKLVLDFRNAQKKANTYYANFLKYADGNDRVHAGIRQGGTETGRMSYAEPNLQNLPKREDLTAEFVVRRAVIPSPGKFLAMLDYDQMEYRLMLEYAREEDVIGQVLEGVDIHQATANMIDRDRNEAKTLNFMLLYGGGVAKLCVALFHPLLPLAILKELVRKHFWRKAPENPMLLEGLSPQEVEHDLEELRKALALQEAYFAKLPRVKNFTREVTASAAEKGFVRNWAGRICYFANKKFAYAAPNHLIQGGCADVVKIAMNRIDDLLANKRTKMIIQVHDELVLEVCPDEKDVLLEVKKIMEEAYPYKRLPLTVGIDHSFTSWADKTEGLPA